METATKGLDFIVAAQLRDEIAVLKENCSFDFMKKVILILILLTYFNNYSQDKKTIYLDENSNKITFLEFKKKEKSFLFNIAILKKNNNNYKKLRYREYFGKLKNKKKFYQFILKKTKLDSTKVWLIRYNDSLPDLKTNPDKSIFKFIDSTNYFLTQKEFYNQRKKYSPKKHKFILGRLDYLKYKLGAFRSK